MPNYLHPDFLSDPKEYAAAENLWADRWSQLLRWIGQENLWKAHWLNTHFADGTPFQDGNPIFSAISLSAPVAVRILQRAPGTSSQDFIYWIDQLADTSGATIGEELVISCVLTDDNLLRSIDFCHEWITSRRVSNTREVVFPTLLEPDYPAAA